MADPRLLQELAELLGEKAKRVAQNRISTYYPDTGPLRRELYPKHLDFFKAGKFFRERCILAGNRIGKSEGIGGFETVLHATGLYPDWWEGHRYSSPIRAWCCGDTGKTVRDINQLKLLGPVGAFGTGLIPAHTLINHTSKPGVPDAVETIRVKHTSGGESSILFKSYDQGRHSFQGTEQHLIWLDEEPPFDVYVECVMRTTETPWFPGGRIMCTFTPLKGISDVVMVYLPGGKIIDG